MEAIFISYRRSDASAEAGRLFDRLVANFGEGTVLLDVAGLERGHDFRRTIESRLAGCKVMLVVIGQSWLDARDEDGTRRLDNLDDMVRIEVSAALRRDIPTIPVLVDSASMPRARQLPSDLSNLAFRNGVELRHASWGLDISVLIAALELHLSPPSTKQTPSTATAASSPLGPLDLSGELSPDSAERWSAPVARLLGQKYSRALLTWVAIGAIFVFVAAQFKGRKEDVPAVATERVTAPTAWEAELAAKEAVDQAEAERRSKGSEVVVKAASAPLSEGQKSAQATYAANLEYLQALQKSIALRPAPSFAAVASAASQP